jgi:hypothetical protein
MIKHAHISLKALKRALAPFRNTGQKTGFLASFGEHHFNEPAMMIYQGD